MSSPKNNPPKPCLKKWQLLCASTIAKIQNCPIRDGVPVLNGAVPELSNPGEDLYILLNSYTVQHMAQSLAMTKLKGRHEADKSFG